MTDIAPLTRAEQIALGDCEERIERGLKTFFEVGTALIAIRDNRLYRASHGTFELYCRERWNMTPQHANRLALAAGVVASMEPIGSIEPPSTESQARELAKVPAEERADVWAEAVERTAGKPTAAAVRQVAEERSAPVPDVVRQAVEDVTDPAPAAEPSSMPPRKPASPPTAEQSARIPGAILAVLAEAGPGGLTTMGIWARLPMSSVHSSWVQPALRELEEAGRVEPAGRAANGNRMVDLWALAELPDVTPEDLPASPGEGRSAGLPSALSGADASDGSVVDPGAAEKLPAGPDPVAMVAAALDQFVPDPGREAREWGQQLYERLDPVSKFTLWFDVEKAAEFADHDDMETLRHLATSFAEFYRKTLAARQANVVPLRAVR